MASVITLQALHGLSDSETVDAVTFDLRWKAACGLPIIAPAFHSTTLTYWRLRLATSDQPNRIFEAFRTVVAQTAVLAGKTRRASDSAVLDDAVANQDTVTQLITVIRRVRREVPGAAEVIENHCTANNYDDPGKPAIAWNEVALLEEEDARCGCSGILPTVAPIGGAKFEKYCRTCPLAVQCTTAVRASPTR